MQTKVTAQVCSGELTGKSMDRPSIVPMFGGQPFAFLFRHNRQPRLPPWSAIMRRLLLTVVALIFASGCVCVHNVPPGSDVTVTQIILPLRSVVGTATNISNHVEGGGQPKVAVK